MMRFIDDNMGLNSKEAGSVLWVTGPSFVLLSVHYVYVVTYPLNMMIEVALSATGHCVAVAMDSSNVPADDII